MKVCRENKYIGLRSLKENSVRTLMKKVAKGKIKVVLGSILLTVLLSPAEYVHSATSNETRIEVEKEMNVDEDTKLELIMRNLNEIKEETNRQIEEIYEQGYASEDEGGTSINLSEDEKIKLELIMSSLREQKDSYLMSYYDTFNKYCEIYGVNVDEAYALAEALTDNFTSDKFKDDFNIGNTTFYKISRKYPNAEAGIISYIRCLSTNPEEYGVTSEMMHTNTYQNCDCSYEAFTKEVCDIVGVDYNRMLAIMYQETGQFTSSAFINKNNPAGLMTSNGVKKFKTKEQGIVEAVLNVYFRFYQKNKTSVEEMGRVYCPINAKNDPTGMNASWIPGVKKYEQYILSNPNLFENESLKGITK